MEILSFPYGDSAIIMDAVTDAPNLLEIDDLEVNADGNQILNGLDPRGPARARSTP